MIRVLIAASDPLLRESLRKMLESDPDYQLAGLARDGQEAIQLAHSLRPDIALLSAQMSVYDGWQTTEFLMHASSPPDVVLLSEQGTDLRKAMRAGARDLLAWPCTAEVLLPSLQSVAGQRQRRHSSAFANAADPAQMCRIITVSGAKGGVGKTTLATNLAVALRLETGEPTVLIDLYTQFGDVAMLLDLIPRRSLAEMARHPAKEVDPSLLADHFEHHSSGLSVLIGALTPVALDAISAPFLDCLFGLLKQQARFVVLDVPPILHPTTLHALSHASQALLVANLFDLTTLRDTRLLLEAIEGHYVASEKIGIVLNRVSRQNRLSVPDIEKTLGHVMMAQIPNDGKAVPHSVNQGMPFVMTQPRSPVAQSVRHLACQLAEGRSGYR